MSGRGPSGCWCPISQERLQRSVSCLRIHCYKGETMGEEGSRNNSWHLHSTGAFMQVSDKSKVRKRRSGNLGRQKQDLCGGSLVKQRPVPNKARGSCHSPPAFAMAPGENPLTKRLGSLTLERAPFFCRPGEPFCCASEVLVHNRGYVLARASERKDSRHWIPGCNINPNRCGT